MTDISERMVEAAARASVAFAYNDTLATDDDAFALWCANNPDLWRQELRCARAALTAALAVAEQAGAGVFVVPSQRGLAWEINQGLGLNWAYSNYSGNEWEQCRDMLDSAANAVSAAILAGRVTL